MMHLRLCSTRRTRQRKTSTSELRFIHRRTPPPCADADGRAMREAVMVAMAFFVGGLGGLTVRLGACKPLCPALLHAIFFISLQRGRKRSHRCVQNRTFRRSAFCTPADTPSRRISCRRCRSFCLVR